MGLRVSGTCWVWDTMAGPSQAPSWEESAGLTLVPVPSTHGGAIPLFPLISAPAQGALPEPLGVLGG